MSDTNRLWWETMRRWIEKACGNPVYGALTTVMGAIAGTYASVYSSTLIKNFPFAASTPDLRITVIAGGLIFIFGLMFFGGQWAQVTQGKRTVSKLQATVDELQSLPPVSFLGAMTKTYRGCTNLLVTTPAAPGSLNIEAIDTLIRTMLGWTVSLSDRFHVHEQESRTAANVMLFRDKTWLAALQPNDIPPLRTRLKFCDGNKTDVKQRDGLLDLVISLSTTNIGDPGKIDSALIEMAFPIDEIDPSKATAKENLMLLIPGAPTAFAARSVFSYSSHTELMKDADARNMKPSEKNEMRAYLLSEGGQLVKSFVSIPLYPVHADEKAMPIGVLNLHRDTEGLLAGEGTKRFIPICEPLLAGLSWLLQLRAEIEGARTVAARPAEPA